MEQLSQRLEEFECEFRKHQNALEKLDLQIKLVKLEIQELEGAETMLSQALQLALESPEKAAPKLKALGKPFHAALCELSSDFDAHVDVSAQAFSLALKTRDVAAFTDAVNQLDKQGKLDQWTIDMLYTIKCKL